MRRKREYLTPDIFLGECEERIGLYEPRKSRTLCTLSARSNVGWTGVSGRIFVTKTHGSFCMDRVKSFTLHTYTLIPPPYISR